MGKTIIADLEQAALAARKLVQVWRNNCDFPDRLFLQPIADINKQIQSLEAKRQDLQRGYDEREDRLKQAIARAEKANQALINAKSQPKVDQLAKSQAKIKKLIAELKATGMSDADIKEMLDA